MDGKAYFAYETDVSPDWKNFVETPTPPASYKEQLKKDEYVETAWLKLHAKGRNDVLTGMLTKIKYQTHMTSSTIDVKPGQILQLAPGFMRCFCIKPGVLLRLAVAEDIKLHGAFPQHLQWAIKSESTGKPILFEEAAIVNDPMAANTIGGAGNYPLFVDPVRAILGTSSYDDDDLPRVAKKFGLPIPTDIDSRLAFTRGLAKLIGEA